MFAERLYSLYDTPTVADEEHVVCFHKGVVTEGVVLELGNELKDRLSEAEVDKRTARNLFAIYVELAQNIVRYSAERVANDGANDSGPGVGVVVIGDEGGKYFVACGNRVTAKQMDQLRGLLSELQGMDRQQLKSLYRETLRGEPIPGSKGASVGLIDVVRRASEPIEFAFKGLDGDFGFFSLKVFA